jgi:hypothetical protein
VRSFRLVALASVVIATVAAAAEAEPVGRRATYDAPVSGLTVSRGSLWVSIGGDDLVLRLDARTGRSLARVVLPQADHRAFGGGTLAAGRGRIWIAAPVRVTGDPSVGDASGWIGRLDPQSLRLRLVQVHGADRPVDVAVGGAGVWVSGFHVLRRIDPRSGRVTGVRRFHRYLGAVAVTRNAAWVAGSNTDFLKKIDPRTLRVLASVAVGHCSAGSSLVVVGRSIWAATDRGLVAVDAASARIVARIRLPNSGTVAFDGSRLWVLAEGGVYTIQGRTVTKELRLSTPVFGLLAAGPRGAWLADEGTNGLRLIPAR